MVNTEKETWWEIAKLHEEAVQSICSTLRELNELEQTETEIEHNARAIIARLARANILLERYEREAK